MSRTLAFRFCTLLSAVWLAACADARAGNTSAALESPPLRAAFERWRTNLSQLATQFEPGAHLSIELDETRADFSANSSVQQLPAAERRIIVRAGVLEAPELSADGLALLMCHELGHHFGGYPFLDPSMELAAEGSADYFATRVCAPYVFGLQPATEPARSVDDEAAIAARCAHVEAGEPCARLMAAARSLADALNVHFGAAEGSVPPYAELADEPSLAREDAFRVARSVGSRYPSVQCRLDTFVRGALCGLEKPATERTAARSEADALAQSCSVAAFEAGARPGCWFREGTTPSSALDPLDSVWRALE